MCPATFGPRGPPATAGGIQCPHGAADRRAPLFDNAPRTTAAPAAPVSDHGSGPAYQQAGAGEAPSGAGGGRWVEARDRRIGDGLATRDGRTATVTGLTCAGSP